MPVAEATMKIYRELPTALIRWYPFRQDSSICYIGENDSVYNMLEEKYGDAVSLFDVTGEPEGKFDLIKEMFPGFEFRIFCDYDKTKIGKIIDGKSVISPDEFYERYSDHYVLVNSAAANGEIMNELRNHGIIDDSCQSGKLKGYIKWQALNYV